MSSRVHVMPMNDEREHVADLLCPCLPRVDWLNPGVISHNSYDGREIGEVCAKALDLLGCALADHGHEWTTEQRAAYEHAIAVLQMHYDVEQPGSRPEKD